MQQELVERARRGDHDAFAALAGAAIFRLDAAARLILRDPDQAKDAVQETLVRAWRDLPTLRSPDRFDAWLHRLLYRACIDEARRLRRHRVDVELTPIDSPMVGDMTSSINDRDQLDRGFSRLEPEARALIVLHHYLDLPLPDVAIVLGIPLGTAKSRLHRALGSMRAALDADARPSVGDPGGPSRMTLNDGFDRTVSDWLDEQAGHGMPGYLDEVLDPDDPDPTAAVVVEPRKVAPHAIDSSLRTGAQDGLAPRRPRLWSSPSAPRSWWSGRRNRPPSPFGPARPWERPLRRRRWRHLRHRHRDEQDATR